MDVRTGAQGYAWLRVAIGVVLMVTPGVMSRLVSPDARRPAAKLLARMAGARDLTLGIGALQAAAAGAPTRPWVRAAAGSDAGDLLAAALAFRSLPRWRRWGVLLAPAGGMVAGLLLAERVD